MAQTRDENETFQNFIEIETRPRRSRPRPIRFSRPYIKGYHTPFTSSIHAFYTFTTEQMSRKFLTLSEIHLLQQSNKTTVS